MVPTVEQAPPERTLRTVSVKSAEFAALTAQAKPF